MGARYFCKACGARPASKQLLADHVCKKATRNEIPSNDLLPVDATLRPRPPQVGATCVAFDESRERPRVAFCGPDSSNEDAALPNADEATQKATRVSTLYSSSEVEEPGNYVAPAPIEDPRAREQEAVQWLSSRADYLNPYERRFYLGIKGRVLSGTNHLTDAQREMLLGIVEIVKGLEEDDARYRRDNLRARHHMDVKVPGHPKGTCEFCLVEAAQAVAAKEAYDEDMAFMERRAAERAAKGLGATQTSPKPIPCVSKRPTFKSPHLPPKAVTEAPKNG